jgi:hypothetical protein
VAIPIGKEWPMNDGKTVFAQLLVFLTNDFSLPPESIALLGEGVGEEFPMPSAPSF